MLGSLMTSISRGLPSFVREVNFILYELELLDDPGVVWPLAVVNFSVKAFKLINMIVLLVVHADRGDDVVWERSAFSGWYCGRS